ncbi:excinuclease ABC subunit UvrA [Porphyromonas circumdentaria]|uniref:excinuclease ABC subunit UvrA n=1 Tax=Porphyromonas circumdentaria TaxID=29524 RepID=UPI0026DCA118|nr:excinuclease ABC subunit UvrA [Porphyromonas circumdentaria]MDO4721884.1 excinuclease ABC subunit UvrA [Porphyromonas circumdentaria]
MRKKEIAQEKGKEEEEVFASGAIEIRGAKVHNLKNIDVSIPRHKLTVVTGLSGSGKSSLVFDVLLAEGQRRYIETFSAYARSFIGNNTRPDVESIEGLSPVVAIEQKTASNNTRSTVGTVTEIYDFLRLLYARVGVPHSYITGKEMRKYTEQELYELIERDYSNQGIELLAPVVRDRKGHYRELFETLRKKGFTSVYIDGTIEELRPGLMVDRYVKHYIAVVIDKLIVKEEMQERLQKSITLALRHGDGMLDVRKRNESTLRHLSSKIMDAENGLAYPEVSPSTFSFNSPQGYCPVCRGMGFVNRIDLDKLITQPTLSLKKGGLKLLGKWRKGDIYDQIEELLQEYNYTPETPVGSLPPEVLNAILYGSTNGDGDNDFKGLMFYLNIEETMSFLDEETKEWLQDLHSEQTCPECKGIRLNKIAQNYLIDKWRIHELAALDLEELYATLPQIESALSQHLRPVGTEIIKEIRTRLKFLLDVGLYYLSLSRASATLSGGESQRIRLATQIGTGLVEVLYLLDEPGIGLHPSDNNKLIASLQTLRDGENTVVVVEHDQDMMLSADYIIDMGPGAGRLGGKVVFSGTPKELPSAHTITADYLNGIRSIVVPNERRKGNGNFLTLSGATGNNLKNVKLSLPLGTFICVTGVSGSGKSSLINSTLVPAIAQSLYRSLDTPLPYKKLEGLEHIDKLAVVDQSPLGRTPRSNPATYTGLFTEIRQLFVSLPESKARGYKPGRFSFNVAGGRCEECKGNGYKTLAMNFLPDVTIPCDICHGKRYSRETLEVRYRGKSIADVLDMTFNQAAEFFENMPKLHNRLEMIRKVGLGYIKLGQPSTTLSGGESQRVKLAEELSKKDTGRTLYVLDEPTTGLHFEDIRVLLSLVQQLVNKGNTVLIIEHDLDVIKSADYLIDMGPEGGRNGGRILFAGTPEEMIQQQELGSTGLFLKKRMK